MHVDRVEDFCHVKDHARDLGRNGNGKFHSFWTQRTSRT